MNDRQHVILDYLVQDYLKTGAPIASKHIAAHKGVDSSSATIRNDMVHLENEGYISQPHTSSGRIPTISGIRYYLESSLKPHQLSRNETSKLRRIMTSDGLHGLARQAASYSRGAIILARNESDLYFTGFSHLFSKPEFSDINLIHAISSAVDHIEQVLPELLDRSFPESATILIGDENPLGKECSIIFIKTARKNQVLFGLLNPLRTAYAQHVGLLNTIKEII